jgi:hypothetical protein
MCKKIISLDVRACKRWITHQMDSSLWMHLALENMPSFFITALDVICKDVLCYFLLLHSPLLQT